MSEYYYEVSEVPLDDYDGDDHDDEPTTDEQLIFPDGIKTAAMSRNNAPTGIYVPFVRTIKLGTIGADVLALKRALSKAGYGKWGNWGDRVRWMGPWRVELLKKFQKANGLPADGVYGFNTHKKLAPFYDSYGVWLLSQVHILTPEEQKRKSIVAAAMIGYQNRAYIHYTQSALRMQGVRNKILPPKYPIWEDCSSFATWCYWAAKAPDPNGLGYNGFGYTGTQINNGVRVWHVSAAEPGDLIFYGWRAGIPTHVALYVGSGRVVSHGAESGPLLLAATYREITSIHSYL